MDKTAPLRLFRMVRDDDVHGMSGTGVVAAGVQFPSGKCTLEWLSPLRSVTTYDSKEVMEALHGHDGKTRIEWITPPIDSKQVQADQTPNASQMVKGRYVTRGTTEL